MNDAIVIVGGGHAAAQLCNALAEAALASRVHLVSEEAAHPYHRPPLSKTFLKSDSEAHQLHRDAAWYQAQGIHLHLGVAATRIDRAQQRLHLSSGEQLAYGRLVLATGTRARALPQLSGALDNVSSLRTVADAQAVRARLLAGQRRMLTIVGGGFIGLEVAATARHLGWQVQVLEAAPRLLARAVSPALAQVVQAHHEAAGVQVRLGVRIGAPQLEGTRLVALEVDGRPEPVDELLVGIGAVPETALAQQAGLAVDNGIRVDAAMCSSDPAILAIGDCACFEHEGRWLRLESVQNANDQAKVAAATLRGEPASYRPVPTFWSDQGGLRLQMVGLWRPGLQAVERRGAAPAGASQFHYDGERLACVESANAPVDHMLARRLLERGLSPPPAAVGDPQVALKTLM